MKSKFLRRIGDQSQVTIPKKFVRKLGLLPGDILEAREKDGVISLTPTFVVPKSKSCFVSKKWMV
jgi:AbrB family looped-hinge helix DNA binding protein